MNLQRTPNGWSCLAAAFATVLEIPFSEMVKRVGHDGSAILWPELNEPFCRRAFHPQEMIRVADDLGKTVTEIQARPMIAPLGEAPVAVETRFLPRVYGQVGVLTGLNAPGRRHAVAWNGALILDVATGATYTIENFSVESFWRIT